MSVERDHGLTRNLAHTRPADILIASWDRATLDQITTSPLCSAILSESCHQVCATVFAAVALKHYSNGPQMPLVGLVLHSVSCGDLWQLGQGGPRYLLQAGILPGHSPVLPEISSCGRNLRPVEYGLVRSIARAILVRELLPS